MKAEILALLRSSQGYVSGQELCERFGVSRAAVWKAVNQLKKEGYEIEAVQNRGYKLAGGAVFGQNDLESRIHTKWAGAHLSYQEETTSTNALAKVAGEGGAPHGSLYVADMQTAGRGRRGRAWTSPPGTNVYYSIMLRPSFAPDRASMLTLVMARSVACAIEKTTGLRTGIKWPNDIVINGKKVCGILTEMSAEQDYIHYVVIGVGINVGLQEFPRELLDKATSLQAESGENVSRGELIQHCMECFEEDYECFAQAGDLSGLLDSYNQMLLNRDREVRVLDPRGEYTGTARGINERGELLVKLADGTVAKVYAGEVSVRGLYSYV